MKTPHFIPLKIFIIQTLDYPHQTLETHLFNLLNKTSAWHCVLCFYKTGIGNLHEIHYVVFLISSWVNVIPPKCYGQTDKVNNRVALLIKMTTYLWQSKLCLFKFINFFPHSSQNFPCDSVNYDKITKPFTRDYKLHKNRNLKG